MTESLENPQQRMAAKPMRKGGPHLILPPATLEPSAGPSTQSGLKNLQPFSPVTERGCFEFDRVIKSGELLKRTKRTKNWKSVYLVLRPNLLSIYKDPQESLLRHQLTLSDITAVALQKDRRRKDHTGAFGLFSPSRNFHFEASTESDAQSWVDLIRKEARLDVQEEEIMFGSPGSSQDRYTSFGRAGVNQSEVLNDALPRSRGLSSSSSELDMPPASGIAPFTLAKRGTARQASSTRDFSGHDQYYSDFSDAQGAETGRDSPPPSGPGKISTSAVAAQNQVYAGAAPSEVRNVSQSSGIGKPTDTDRVIWHGYLLYLKSNRGGVRQWRRCWVVLRPKTLGLYKNEEEYAASLIVPVSAILDAVEIDPISRAKQFCMQVIADDRSYRFATASEDELSKWLGGIKSLLAKKKEATTQRTMVAER